MKKEEIIEKYWYPSGHLNANQRDFLIKVLSCLQPKYCLEIGFATGRSCITTLASCSPEKFVSIDHNLDYMGAREHSKILLNDFKNLEIIEKNSSDVLIDSFFAQKFPNGIDYAFVDGGHTYDIALNDISVVYQHLNQWGIIIVDDYYSCPPDGCILPEVGMAVDDFCKKNNIKVEKWNNNGKGFAIIKKVRSKAWLTEGANDFIETLFQQNKELNVLEFGMGVSTIWLSDNVKNLTSIEHNKTWFNKISAYLCNKNNVNAILHESEQIIGTDYIKDCYSVELDGFKDETFDLILIDGRNRTDCFKKSERLLKPGGYIMLDNSERDWYKEIFEFYKDKELFEYTQTKPDEFGFYYGSWKTSWWKK